MITQKRGCYTVKTYTNDLYTWCPDTSINKNRPTGQGKKNFCTATPNSQGQDLNCTYVYNIRVTNGVQEKIAYVACDYVQ